jgi:hypothetical protein
MSKPFKHDPQWAKAKRLCRLNQDDIAKAKELGLNPKSLMKNIPSPKQRWKLPVKEWVRELYDKRFGHRIGAHRQSNGAKAAKQPQNNHCIEWDAETNSDIDPRSGTGANIRFEQPVPDDDCPF